MSDGKVIIETELDTKGVKSGLEGIKKDIDGVSSSVDNKVGNSTSKANKSIEESRQVLNNYAKSLEDTGNKLNSLGSATGEVGSKLMAVSAPFVAFSGYAIKATTDFQQGMAEVSAISGATGADLEKLTEKAKQMGQITKFSATESAEALKYEAMA